jgi:NAD(P)H-hydrate epimerase
VVRLGDVVQTDDVAQIWPARAEASHKTRSGHLLVIAGCQSMAGAAVLTCRAALRAGVGLVTLLTPSSSHVRLAALPPEVMVQTCGDDTLADVRTVDLSRYTAIAAGPGLGVLGGTAIGGLRHLWQSSNLPVVFDADALVCATGAGPSERVITPHPGEASRLLSVSVAEVQADRFSSVRQLAAHQTALLKGPHTLVATPGQHIRVNATGNAVLGTAGAGDVLTGVVGALLARGLSGHDAASAGAFVHGRAADLLRTCRTQGWVAGDVADAIPDAVASLQGETC